MVRNEVKKALYKEKPVAKIIKEYDDSVIYETSTSLGNIVFEVPFDDMGDGLFDNEVPAQLLIRWIVNGKNT